MRVLVHLNRGTDKSYLLNFGKGVKPKDITKLLEEDGPQAVDILLGYARCLKPSQRIEIPAQDRYKAEWEADVVVSQDSCVTNQKA